MMDWSNDAKFVIEIDCYSHRAIGIGSMSFWTYIIYIYVTFEAPNFTEKVISVFKVDGEMQCDLEIVVKN